MSREKLVSVIMPAYNCEDYIGESIETVLQQTYHNLELIIVDDCSTDRTLEIVNKYAALDDRISVLYMEKNSGAALARNYAVQTAKGSYLAFLDSDDTWIPEKLEKQICFMMDNKYDFSCTSYGKINNRGEIQDMVVRCRTIYDYDLLLKECPGNSTVIYNAETLGKFYAEDIKRRNDFVMWLKAIKTAKVLYGLDEVLGYHRERTGSISYDKRALIKYQWYVYRKIEKLPRLKCCYLLGIKVKQIVDRKYG